MDKQLWQPKAVALHTAFKAQDKDYNWYIHGGDPLLLEKLMKAAHYALIRDRKGDAPRIIVIAQTERVGLLVGTMRTERRDYVNGIIYDTLYLEFDSQDGAAILSSVATLLAAYDQDNEHREYQQYEKFFLDYAEGLAEKGENAQIPTPPSIDLPMYAEMAGDNCEFNYSEVAVASTPDNRKKCARYLKWLSQQTHLSKSATVVSTGRVSKDDLQKYANTYTGGTLIVLTLSDSVQGEIDLRSLRERLSRSLPRIGIVIILLLGSLFFFTRDRTPPQLASLAFQASDKPALTLPFPGAVGTSATTALPRVGVYGAFILTFKKPIQQENTPRLSIGAGQEWVTLPQPCQSQTEDKQTWKCPVTISTENPNQPAAFTLAIMDAKNRIIAEGVKVSVASANIMADLVGSPTFVWHDALTWRSVIVEANASYGVAEVLINNLKAVKDERSPHHWQVEIPTYPTLEDQAPLTITVKDNYDNTFAVRFNP